MEKEYLDQGKPQWSRDRAVVKLGMEWDDELTSHTEIATTSALAAELIETAADYEVISERIRNP